MLVERLHLVVLALVDQVLERRAVERVDDRLGGATGVHEHLDDGDAPGAVGPSDQSLGDDPAQCLGQRTADLLLLERLEEVDDAVDGLRGVDGVQGREHQVTGLGSREGGAHGLHVAYLTDQDHVRVLPHRGTERNGEVGSVVADLALGDDRLLVLVQDLDRVLDRDDVDLFVGVDQVDHRGEGRRLAGAGRTGHQHQAARLEGELAEHLGQAQLLQRLGTHGHPTEHQAEGAARTERVHAEAPDPAEGVGEVGLVGRSEPRHQLHRQHLFDHVLGVLGPQVGHLQAPEPAVHTQPRRRSDLAVQVRALAAGQGMQERDDGLRLRVLSHPGLIG